MLKSALFRFPNTSLYKTTHLGAPSWAFHCCKQRNRLAASNTAELQIQICPQPTQPRSHQRERERATRRRHQNKSHIHILAALSNLRPKITKVTIHTPIHPFIRAPQRAFKTHPTEWNKDPNLPARPSAATAQKRLWWQKLLLVISIMRGACITRTARAMLMRLRARWGPRLWCTCTLDVRASCVSAARAAASPSYTLLWAALRRSFAIELCSTLVRARAAKWGGYHGYAGWLAAVCSGGKWLGVQW